MPPLKENRRIRYPDSRSDEKVTVGLVGFDTSLWTPSMRALSLSFVGHASTYNTLKNDLDFRRHPE